MKFRFQPWQLAAIVILLCAGAVIFAWRRHSRTFDAAAMLECLPPDQATHVYVDFDALRRSGILQLISGNKASEDPDYAKFVAQTGFDYSKDLDAAAVAFFHGSEYFALRGRFVWSKLADYAKAQGGSCSSSICSMPASTPDRHISYYMLSSSVLALAVSPEEHGVNMIGPNQWKNPPQLPAEPVWISAPSFVFSDVKNLPTGTHSFLSPLAQADQVTFAVGPAGANSQQLQIRLNVDCPSAEVAATMAAQLNKTTDLLKKMLERDHMKPNANDLSGVLVSGSFEQHDKNVAGKWPIERGFVEALASGQVQ
jgi:hypothetical protein